MIQRVLQVASGDLWGGAEAAVFELTCELASRGIEICAVIMNPGELAERLRSAHIRTIALDERNCSFRQLAAAVRNEIRSFRPQVVHSHRKKENVIAACASTLSGAPYPSLIQTIHGAPEHRRPLWTAGGLSDAVAQIASRSFAARVAVSADLHRIMGGTADSRLVTIHNGIRVARDVLMPRVPSHVPRVGFAGRLVPVKRVDLIVRLAAELKGQGAPMVFEIVGDGPLLPELRDLATQLKVQQSVHFLGFRSDIKERFAHWDATLLTSDHEGLPMICLESLAAGVPVLARKVGGLPEVITTERQGMLVDSADPAVLAARLRELVSAASASETRTSRLPDSFDVKCMADSYASLYSRVSRHL